MCQNFLYVARTSAPTDRYPLRLKWRTSLLSLSVLDPCPGSAQVCFKVLDTNHVDSSITFRQILSQELTVPSQ